MHCLVETRKKKTFSKLLVANKISLNAAALRFSIIGNQTMKNSPRPKVEWCTLYKMPCRAALCPVVESCQIDMEYGLDIDGPKMMIHKHFSDSLNLQRHHQDKTNPALISPKQMICLSLK